MARVKQAFSQPQVKPPDTVNHDGFPAYTRDLEEQFLQTLLTNTIGQTYYADSKDLLAEAQKVHMAMLAKDPKFFADALPFARQRGYMRTQPTYALAMLAQKDPVAFERIFGEVIMIPSDLQDFMTMVNSMGRGQGGRALKRTAANWLNNKLSEYWVLKYNGDARGYSLADLVQTLHPKPKNGFVSGLYGYLMDKDDKSDAENYNRYLTMARLNESYKQLAAYIKLKSATTTKEQIELICEGKLPHEIVTGSVKMTPELWAALLQDMPVFATLRNLNTMDRAGVLDANRKIIEDRLTNPEILAKSRILPFRFVKAFDQVSKAWTQDALRLALERSFANIPDIDGRTAIFLDISGSMSGEYLQTGSIFGFSLFKKTNGNSLFWLFDDRVEDAKPSMHDSILTQAARVRARGGTSTDLPMRQLAQRKEKVDNIILITDEQQNTGRPFYQELVQYRRTVNPNAKCFIIDIAPYRHAVVPQDDKNTFYIYGWSDQVLNFISLASQGFGSMVDVIRNGKVSERGA